MPFGGGVTYSWLRCSNISSDHMLYSEKDLEKSMDKIETVNFHQVRDREVMEWRVNLMLGVGR